MQELNLELPFYPAVHHLTTFSNSRCPCCHGSWCIHIPVGRVWLLWLLTDMFWVGMLQEHGHSLVYNICEWERILIYVAKGGSSWRVTGLYTTATRAPTIS